MLGYLVGGTSGGRGLQKVKPGLFFLLQLAWESRTRLPLLIMSGFMVFGIRIQLEINIDRTVRFVPRLRLEDEEYISDDDSSSSAWNSDNDSFFMEVMEEIDEFDLDYESTDFEEEED